ncbi:MAG: sigma-54 dependent transcriptional regulator [bacterium]|nr:sigma-54 dependent transcriptional regulator [bacterium]
MKTILVVDDEKNYLLVLSALLSEEGYEVMTTQEPEEALRIIEEDAPALLITDMKMPRMTGMELLKKARAIRPDLQVIIMTAFGTVETAVEAMKHGAYHYILKPFHNDEIKLMAKRALGVKALVEEKRQLKEELSARLGFENLIFESEPMRQVADLMEQVAAVKTTVLIEGESGTGKEVVARTIHENSSRSDKPFIAVNCGALTETLLESELFGHEKGAFTGATAQKKGRFEMADGGTLFLDEIATTSPALQIRLLRVLQEQTFERVGGTKTIKVDVRVIAASNRNLKELIEKGDFREDLYYRLNVFTINLPPIRDRRKDILLLSRHYMNLYAAEIGKGVEDISPEAMANLENYGWPGNVRELRNAMERAVVVCQGNKLESADLPLELRGGGSGEACNMGSAVPDLDFSRPLPEMMDEMEKEIIAEALKRSGGVSAKAARLLGVSPTNLQYKIGKYGLN